MRTRGRRGGTVSAARETVSPPLDFARARFRKATQIIVLSASLRGTRGRYVVYDRDAMKQKKKIKKKTPRGNRDVFVTGEVNVKNGIGFFLFRNGSRTSVIRFSDLYTYNNPFETYLYESVFLAVACEFGKTLPVTKCLFSAIFFLFPHIIRIRGVTVVFVFFFF